MYICIHLRWIDGVVVMQCHARVFLSSFSKRPRRPDCQSVGHQWHSYRTSEILSWLMLVGFGGNYTQNSWNTNHGLLLMIFGLKVHHQDLEDAPVVAAPSEEEVAMAWRPKDWHHGHHLGSFPCDYSSDCHLTHDVCIIYPIYITVSHCQLTCTCSNVRAVEPGDWTAYSMHEFAVQENASGSSSSENFLTRGHAWVWLQFLGKIWLLQYN